MQEMYETTHGNVFIHEDSDDTVYPHPYYSMESSENGRLLFQHFRDIQYHLFCLQLGATSLKHKLPPITKLESVFFHQNNDLTLAQMQQLKISPHYAEMSEYGRDAFDDALAKMELVEKWKKRLTSDNNSVTVSP